MECVILRFFLFLSSFVLCGVGLGCGADVYEFRSEDRPEYKNTVSVGELAALQESGEVTIVDVRLFEDYEADPVLIAGAKYKDPEMISGWSNTLRKDRPVVAYCVKGKWVSQKAATFLKDKGFEVYSLEGGIEAWKENNAE
ncbi:MAG: hypothetical protein HOH43_07020 [Candidatus Latescibacteria bacterium]|nr:hypothetical protein [Candidatus Latescibacterota bacterium]